MSKYIVKIDTSNGDSGDIHQKLDKIKFIINIHIIYF